MGNSESNIMHQHRQSIEDSKKQFLCIAIILYQWTARCSKWNAANWTLLIFKDWRNYFKERK